MNYVLFSPVGGTDPISFERDGGILHICRKYKPSCAVLYLSGEMLAHQSADDRYRKALHYLADEADFQLEIRTEERPDLTQVHLFDIFYQEFERLLRSIHAEFPKHGLLVNLSSGTPAMKSALAVLSTLMDFPVTAIQVDSPNQRHNGRRDDPADFDLDLYWECNLDRDPDTYQDRCRESKEENLRGKLQRQALNAHLSVYDYQAARMVGAQMGDLLQPDAREWLDAACLRVNQEWRNIQPQALREKMIPKAYSDEERSIFEYLLGLQIQLKRKEYAGFLRGLTPAIYRLSLFAVKNIAHIPIDSYCDHRDYLYAERLNQDEMGKRILKIFLGGGNLAFRDGFLSSELCCRLLENITPEEKCVKPLVQLRDVEKKVRNLAAHTIVPITEQFIVRESRYSPIQIFNLLQEAASAVLSQTLIWNSYDLMNDHIRKVSAES